MGRKEELLKTAAIMEDSGKIEFLKKIQNRIFISANHKLVKFRLITGLLVVVGSFLFVNMIGRYLLFSNTIYIKNEPTAEIRILTVTGYSSEPNQTDSTPFLTASQKLVQEGFVACPREFPFGTLVEIENKRYECQDRLSLKYDNRIDIWFTSRNEALEWGKQELAVRILK